MVKCREICELCSGKNLVLDKPSISGSFFDLERMKIHNTGPYSDCESDGFHLQHVKFRNCGGSYFIESNRGEGEFHKELQPQQFQQNRIGKK